MKKKKDYVEEISALTGRPYEDVAQELQSLKERTEITDKEYYKHRLWEQTETQRIILAKRVVRKRIGKEKNLNRAAEVMGVSRKELQRRIKAINDNDVYNVTSSIYATYELFRYEGAELEDILRLLARRKELKASLTGKFRDIDNGLLQYADIESELEELHHIFQVITPESRYEKLGEKLAPSRPDLLSDEKAFREAILDMAITMYLLGFGVSEYVSFHFTGRSLEEKRTFITDKERMKVMETINDVDSFDLLDSKSQSYALLKKYYGRKLLYIQSPEEYPLFKRFCFGRKTIVVKPDGDSLGRGIKPVSVKDKKNLKAVFDELCEEYQSFIVEGLIIAHERMRNLNPDSINTVRLITYFDGEKAIVHDAFMKVGKKGSFVDNGGAGGIFVSVDTKTGMLKSDGCDERGVVYEVHPDTGVKFYGYQLPNWDKALKLALKLADKVPGLSYIGWDFACTKRGSWIVVEGNAKTQFFGQQCTTGVGKRKDFLETVNYQPVEEESAKEEKENQVSKQADAAAQAEE